MRHPLLPFDLSALSLWYRAVASLPGRAPIFACAAIDSDGRDAHANPNVVLRGPRRRLRLTQRCEAIGAPSFAPSRKLTELPLAWLPAPLVIAVHLLEERREGGI